MQELIYKQDAHDKLEYMYLLIERDRGQGNEVAKGLRMACKAIGDIKAVDAEMSCSVRHGRWETIDPSFAHVYCSECGAAADKHLAKRYKGCPFCLCVMDATDTNVGGKGGDDNG